ncbi:MAG: YjbH domain-containing protein, partial [Simkania negevensis]|nr:YjbH domain-containing protein [Simkania negevensis]
TLLAEWDAINYKQHPEEHPKGRSVKSRINLGLSTTLFDFLQLSVSSLRGEKIAASASLHCNFGDLKGFFPKVDNPPLYNSPLNREPIGAFREEKELAHELAYAFSKQGFNLYQAYITTDEERGKALWLKLINIKYRVERDVKKRIVAILATLSPANVRTITVVIEADGVPTHEYQFKLEELQNYREDKIGAFLFETLTPMKEPTPPPNLYEGALIYQRRKKIWTLTLRPRLLSFFGSSTGKYKYSFGLTGGPEGYLFDQIYYNIQGSYNIKSNCSDIGDRDLLNPSQLLQVRTDAPRYYQTNSFSLDQAYIQKGSAWGKGWYIRGALGYFEAAYGGVGAEVLYYPVSSCWAVGVEGACVLKRKYHGLGFTTKVKKYKETTPTHVHFIGYQYFLDLYYDIKPLQVGLKVSVGQFLARDKGARFEATRYFPSGMRFTLWYTLTSAHDIVNGSRYHEKGVAFFIPLDFFLKKSSRSMIAYALSVWLRDSGAKARTGKELYPTLHSERDTL